MKKRETIERWSRRQENECLARKVKSDWNKLQVKRRVKERECFKLVSSLYSSLCSYIKPYLCYQCIFMHFRDRPENPDSSTDLHHFLPPGIKIVEDVNVRQSVSLFLSLSLKIREFSRLLTNLVLLQSTSPRDTLLVTWKTYTCFRFPCKSFSCSLQIQEIIQGKNSKT